MLEDKKNNYLMCIYCRQTYFGIAVVDITTGEFFTTQITWGSSMRKLLDETARFKPSEIIANEELIKKPEYKSFFEDYLGIRASVLPDQVFDPAYCEEKILSLFKDNPLHDLELARCATGALLDYIESTQKVDSTHIESIQAYKIEQYMMIDSASRRNLEITETMRDAKKKGSLLWVLDKTSTAMGGRMLRRWLEQPLMDVDEIQMRLDAVEELKAGFMVRNELMDLLRGVYDIERLAGKLVFGNINARDLISLKLSLSKLPYIKEMITGLKSGLNGTMAERLDLLEDMAQLIERAIDDDPPLTIKEGGIIKEGFNEEVDRLRKAATEGKNWIADLEAKERERTGIKSLKIRYNDNFGYYIEVTKANIGLIPEDYVRKQTLVNSERFTIEALAELEKPSWARKKEWFSWNMTCSAS